MSEWDSADACLLPFEVDRITQALLQEERQKLTRRSLTGEELDYILPGDDELEVDQFESNRRFLDDIEEFLKIKAEALGRVRNHLGLPLGVEKLVGRRGGGRKKADESKLRVKTLSRCRSHIARFATSHHRKWICKTFRANSSQIY